MVLAGNGQSYAGASQQPNEHNFFYPGGLVGGALPLGGIAEAAAGGGFGGERWGDERSGFGDDLGGGDW